MTTFKVGIAGLRRSVGPAQIFGIMPDCEIAAGCDFDPVALNYFGTQFPAAKLFTNYNEMLEMFRPGQLQAMSFERVH